MSKSAAAGTTKPKLAVARSKFKDAAGNGVTVVARQRRSGWLTYVDYREKGKKAQRGIVAAHDGQDAGMKAAAAASAHVEQLRKQGWTEVVNKALVSAFSELPKAVTKKK